MNKIESENLKCIQDKFFTITFIKDGRIIKSSEGFYNSIERDVDYSVSTKVLKPEGFLILDKMLDFIINLFVSDLKKQINLLEYGEEKHILFGEYVVWLKIESKNFNKKLYIGNDREIIEC